MLSVEVHEELGESDPVPAQQRYEQRKVGRSSRGAAALATLREAALWRTHAVEVAGPEYWAPDLPPEAPDGCSH